MRRILVLNLVVVSSLANANPQDPPKKNFYFFLDSFVTTTYKVDSDGRKIQTNERIFFKKGDFINVNKDEKTGLLYAFINSDPHTREVVIIPQTTMKSGIAQNGQSYTTKSELTKEAEEGSVTALGRALGNKGTEDALFYYDGSPGARVPLTSTPAGDDFRCEDKDIGKSNCVARPSTEDKLKVLDSKIVYTVSPRTGEYSPRLYYHVQTYYCRQGTSEECEKSRTEKDLASGWVAADRLATKKKDAASLTASISQGEKFYRRAREIKDADEKYCDKSALNKEIPQVSDLVSLAEQKNQKQILTKVGACLEKPYVDGIKKIENDMIRECSAKYKGVWNHDLSAEKNKRIEEFGSKYFKNKGSANNATSNGETSPFKNIVEKNWNEKIKQDNGKKSSPTAEQLYAIDSLARTLYGEMRDCSAQSPAFYQAIARVMMNRAAIVKNEGWKAPFYKDEKRPMTGESLQKVIPKVVSEGQQFSSWNEDDVNLKSVLCPSQMDPSKKGQQAWEDAVKVASQAVLDTENFLKDTNEITQTHYSSNMEPAWAKKKTRQDAFRIADVSYSEPECLILWNDESNKQIEKLGKDLKSYALFKKEH